MADDAPRIDLGLDAQARPVILLDGSDETARDMATVLRLAPWLAKRERAADIALAANHLAHGGEYRVITDPHAYEEAYRARLASEDPNAPFREGAVRLHDFGVPDFAAITAPHFEGGHLVFFASDMYLGVPYRVEMASVTAAPDYTPVPLTPVAGSSGAAPETPGVARRQPPLDEPPALQPMTPEEMKARESVKP